MAITADGIWPRVVSVAACAVVVVGVVIAAVKSHDNATPDAAGIAVGEPSPSAPSTDEARGFADIDGARIENADSEPGNWLAHGRTYGEQRFSPLTDINDKNVGELGLAWSLETDTHRGLEASPIVVDGVMFITLNWGVTIAVDARSGKEIWRFDPEVPGEWGRYGCCDVVNRGAAVWKGRVYVASFDGHLFALDAKDGSVVWKVKTIPGSPYTSTGAPRIVNDKVIIGNGGAEYGVRGYVTAYDTETGAQVWRFYTVPGDPSKPVENPELTKAMPTWKGGEWWKLGGGGTAWDSMVYDAKSNTIFIGTGNGSPWTREIRSPGGGDNLYLSSILALDPDTGKMKWYYQETPGDNWDYTSTQPLMIADLKLDGKERHVLMHAPKNGFFYVLDAETGELLSANNYAIVTWAKGVDLKTGRPIEDPALAFNKNVALVQPSANGAHNWHPMAFNPNTGLVYIPGQDIAFPYSLDKEWKEKNHYSPEANWWNLGISYEDLVDTVNSFGELPPAEGFLKAWDPVAGKVKWQVAYPAALNGGVLTTAGNLVFQGTADGHLYAYKADTGEKVWSQDIQTGVVAPPVTYTVDGVQYIAVLAGWGGVNITSGDARTSAAAKYGNEGKLLVYKIGGTAQLEKLALRDQTIPEWPALTADTDTVRKGEVSYARHCGFCHGSGAISPGVTPDLRRMDENIRSHFQDIVRGGMLKDNGMASFGDLLSEEDAEAIKSYIQKRAIEDRARQAPVR
ncbi:MAG: PQQ-dependent dehydrogenase, methanol/ethanol family [Parvibaculum sp.]|nr:PQQ-dependent dehydrogenase, methanol/ethanol family [Parvibaculum sp.]